MKFLSKKYLNAKSWILALFLLSLGLVSCRAMKYGAPEDKSFRAEKAQHSDDLLSEKTD